MSAAAPFDPALIASLDSLELKARYVMEGFLSGIHESPFHGWSIEFSEYRRYQPGDDLRHLDWRLFARSDRLCIKRYSHETNARVYLVCDCSGSMAYRGARAWGSKFECARVLSAALSWIVLRQGDAAGLVALAGAESAPVFLRPAQRLSQLGQVLARLDSLQPAGGACLKPLLDHVVRLSRRRSIILFVSDLLEPAAELAESFRQLRFQGHDCLVFQVMDPDELDFPFQEPQVFEDLETGAHRSVDPATARDRYLTRLEAFLASHDELFRSLEIPVCRLRTDENLPHRLAQFLADRSRMR
jgi:uncharacterized protein (DUF58 family)